MPGVAKIVTSFFVLFSISASSVFAHVIVEPKEVGIGKSVKFIVDVPSEKDASTVSLRLVLPTAMYVGIYSKPGWEAEIVNTQSEEENLATEIIWTGGEIPPQFKDEFSFYTQVPATETTLAWKAYQTYDDGTVISWELDPDENPPKDEEGNPDFSEFGPYSETKIINDLAEDDNFASETNNQASKDALILGIAAIFISSVALSLQFFKK